MSLRRLGLLVLALGAVVCAGYWAILATQPGPADPPLGPFLVSLLILVPAVACAAASWPPGSSWSRLLLLGWSSLTLLAMAVIAAFSIGIVILPVAVLALVATGVSARRVPRVEALGAGLAGAALGVATVIAFLSVQPFLPPGCPSSGSSSGESDWPAGLLTPSIRLTFTCHDGRLVTWTRTVGS